MTDQPRRPADRRHLRRLGGTVVLLAGVLLAGSALRKSWPREHTVVFRLPSDLAAVATRLEASFTPIGDREPARALTLALNPPNPRNLRQKVNLPNGEYIVALELTVGDKSGPSAPEKSETSHARRVRLTEQETLVVFDAEGSD
jgi:hypothetical protein